MCGEGRGSSQFQKQWSVWEAVVVTSVSFGRESSRWPFEVKGKPVGPVRSSLRGGAPTLLRASHFGETGATPQIV